MIIKRYKSGEGFVTYDVTDEIRDSKLGFNSKKDQNPNYNRYEDEEYIRLRLGISPDDEKFDMAAGAALVRRKDLRNGVIPQGYFEK